MKMSTKLEDDLHKRSLRMIERGKNDDDLLTLSDGSATIENLKRMRANLLDQVNQSLNEGPKRKKLPPVNNMRKCYTPR